MCDEPSYKLKARTALFFLLQGALHGMAWITPYSRTYALDHDALITGNKSRSIRPR